MQQNRLVGLLSAVTLLAGVAVGAGGSVGAASPLLPILPTTTSVSASPNIVVTTDDGGQDAGFTAQSTTLTATVVESPLGGLIVTPTGPVSFTAADTHGDRLNLGAANLSTCLLNVVPCKASVSSNAFFVAPADQAKEDGTTWTVTATYGGGLLAKGSAGTTTVTAVEGESTSCANTTGCDLLVFNGDDSAAIDLNVPCTSNCQVASSVLARKSNAIANAAGEVDGEAYAGFGAPPMSAPAASPCQAPADAVDGSGASLNAYTNFPTTLVSAANPADMTYYLFGTPALQQQASSDPTSFCYGDTVEFTQANGSAAPFDPVTGQFEGVLPNCSTGQLPCSENEQFLEEGQFTFGEDTPPQWSIDIRADNDPVTGKH